MTERYRMFAGYNAWANERLYAAAAKLTDAEYRADRGAFFKSVHGTLNHLLVGDRIWMQRFTGQGEAPARLDTILFDDLASLRGRAPPGGCADRRLDRRARRGRAGPLVHLPDHHQSGDRDPEAGAGARSFLQPPDPSPWAGAWPAHGDPRAGLRSLLRSHPVSAGNRPGRHGAAELVPALARQRRSRHNRAHDRFR